MANERWDSPFPCTIAFALFKKHFTELNDVYWAHVPAANTIEKKAQEALPSGTADPKSYFLIPDSDDHRIAPTYNQWKSYYREFSNYTRLNMLMLLSSCFETYMRTIISLACESKPGVVIHCPEAVDGCFLLLENQDYGNFSSKEYQFSGFVDQICKGEWSIRANSYKKLFGSIPLSESEITLLDELRHKRNLVGHYFGREKSKYEVPLYLIPTPVQRLSHNKLIQFFSVVYESARKIDQHLHQAFIGSYDIIKFHLQNSKCRLSPDSTVNDQARELLKTLGNLGFPSAGIEYAQNIISYTLIDSQTTTCRYSEKSCILSINRQLKIMGINLLYHGKCTSFSKRHFRLFCQLHSFKDNPELCKKWGNPKQGEYFYSAKAIDLIISSIKGNPDTFVDGLLLSLKGSENI